MQNKFVLQIALNLLEVQSNLWFINGIFQFALDLLIYLLSYLYWCSFKNSRAGSQVIECGLSQEFFYGILNDIHLNFYWFSMIQCHIEDLRVLPSARNYNSITNIVLLTMSLMQKPNKKFYLIECVLRHSKNSIGDFIMNYFVSEQFDLQHKPITSLFNNH